MTIPIHPLYGGYFYPETSVRLGSMSVGNGFEIDRDLSMKKRDVWETRPYPAKLHHWTAGEFERFIIEHNYPGNTIKDRKRFHVQAIKDALVRGIAVPKMVFETEEAQFALTDAKTEVISSDRGGFMAAQTEWARQSFEASVSKRRAFLPSREPLKEILLKAVVLCGEGEVYASPDFSVEWHDRPMRVFQAYNGSGFQVQDAAFPVGSYSGEVRFIERKIAEEWVTEAVNNQSMKFDDMLYLIHDRSKPLSLDACYSRPRY